MLCEGVVKKYIFEAIENGDEKRKEEQRRVGLVCVNKIVDYFNCVVNDRLYYSTTPKDRWNRGMLRSYHLRMM